MKEKIQSFGRFLSAMVMPNIGAFIAWGLITALFIPTGWVPNETLNALVGPMQTYLLPVLIGYTGGTLTGDKRGGVIGGIATMGVIVASDIPMFLGAMIVGPLAGWIIKKIDKALASHIRPGFEMLVNNFTLGITGAAICVIGFLGFAPIITMLINGVTVGVEAIVNAGLLPLANILIEPAKVLFLNNALNHGVFSPLGIAEVEQMGKSAFFLLEANPGPGLGILLAYMVAGKGTAKQTAPGAVLIHFFGGIHEIYFPYILMNPSLLLAAIAGGVSGTFIFNLLGAGLTGPASPGSIIAVLMMCPKGGWLPVLAGVVISCVVAFVISIPLIRFFGKEKSLEDAVSQKDAMKRQSKGLDAVESASASVVVKKVVFACDAGMGSSAMGASILKKKFNEAGLSDIEVEHASVSSIPEGTQIIVTHENLKERAHTSCPTAELILITNFMAAPEYDELVADLVKRQGK